MDFTRNIIYNPNSKLYVNQSSLYPSLDKTIEMIHKAGGITFLAHLYEYSQTIADNLDTIISNYSLDGIECYYPTFTTEQSNFLNNYCETHNLYKSCGSDFHGYDVKPNNHMGFATEGKKMDKIIISEWIDKINYILKPISSRKNFIDSLKCNDITIKIKNKKTNQNTEKNNEREV